LGEVIASAILAFVATRDIVTTSCGVGNLFITIQKPMTQRDKLFNKFIANPESVSYREMEKILGWYEFEKIQAKGSHIKFKHSHFERDLIIAIHNNDCKAYMKKEARRRILIIKS